jgi:hypothetical protein
MQKLYGIRLGGELVTASVTSEEGEVTEWLESTLFHHFGVSRLGSWDEIRALVFGNVGGNLKLHRLW